MMEMKITPQSGDFAMRELTPEEMNEVAGASKIGSWVHQVVSMVNDIVYGGARPTSFGYDAGQNLVSYETR